jgi:hypothetical protein
MLVSGVCNPRGEAAGYNGLYLTAAELETVAAEIRGTPLKAEHSGEALGTVVSGFVDDAGALHCVARINGSRDGSLEGEIARGLVRDGVAADFSLGYTVEVSHSADRLRAGRKQVLEISLVRRGAREGCRILAYADDGSDAVHVRRDPWADFDLT